MTSLPDLRGRKPTEYYRKDTPEAQARRNGYRRLREQIAGGRAAYYALPACSREVINETAIRMYDLGADVSKAASSELTTREGFVYAITHPLFDGYVKLGRAFDPESRLRGYQTGCPRRSYELHHAVYFTNCYEAELAVHAQLAHLRAEGEWFYVPVAHAMDTINLIKEII